MATTGNPLSGHTTANYNTGYSTGAGKATDGLRDGDQILSASLTNILEGVHGNGIILLEGGAVAGTNRNNPDYLSGAVSKGNNPQQITVKGGYCVLDSSVYKFANGYSGATPQNLTINLTDHKLGTTTDNESKIGTVAALTSGKECLFTIFLSSEVDSDVKHVMFEQSTPVTTGSGIYPSSPSTYLISPKSGNALKDSIVLATIRAIFNGSAQSDNDLAITITEINDKRLFLKPSPLFLTPMTKGIVANRESDKSINSIADLDSFHTETGDFSTSPLGAIWMSHSTDKVTSGGTRLGAIGDDVLFFAGNEGGTKKTLRLAPDRMYVGAPSGTNHFTHDGPNVFIVSPGNNVTYLNPDNTSNEFTAGHIIYIRNNNSAGGHPINFDHTTSGGSNATNYQIAAGQSAIVVRNTSASNPKWSVLINASASGSGAVSQLNNKTANRLVTIGSTTTELDGEANLTFDETNGLAIGSAAGSGKDVKFYTAGTAAHVGIHWDADGNTEGTLYGGVDDHGVDFKFFGESSGKYIEWDQSQNKLNIQGNLGLSETFTVGVAGTGGDVKFYADGANAYFLWDESLGDLILMPHDSSNGGMIGLGVANPESHIDIHASSPKINFKNTTNEHTNGGAATQITMRDHASAVLVKAIGSHDGTANDTKGKLQFYTHNGSSSTLALTIDSEQIATFADNVVIGGDLTINGTTTTVNSTTITVDDTILTLGGDTAPSSNDGKDRGIEFRYYDSSAKLGFFGYDRSENYFIMKTDITNSSESISGTKGTLFANLIGNQSGGTVAASSITSTGNAIFGTSSNPDAVSIIQSTSRLGIRQASPKASLQIIDTGFESITGSGSSGTNYVKNICHINDFRGLKLFISTEETNGAGYEVQEILMTHNSTQVFSTKYATVNHGAACVNSYTLSIANSQVMLTIDYAQLGSADKNFTTKINFIGLVNTLV